MALYGIQILRNVGGRLVDVTAGSGMEKWQAVVADMTATAGPISSR